MDRVRAWLETPGTLMGGVERFVHLVVGGGVCLVAGLWAMELGANSQAIWGGGVVLTVVGIGGLAAGIWTEIEV